MLDLTWRRDARGQFIRAIEYVAARDTAAAERLKGRIEHHVALARAVPGMGRPGRVAGTRELVVHPNYVVIYRTTDARLTVIRVLHSRQQYP